ncbi:hypothetical protein TWF970_011488 [Orbilia oligospora]|uniref:DUF7918 domain-containing protein n=1 Tax=Orbilia oligospora TaxID=2813651 RepID=A0A7C8RKL7_ORBOL|nr:hypothetical protein TWF970_011488 [Orbilia oligospora]
MPTHNGIKCSISVEGSPLPEYLPSTQDTTCTVSLAASEGQRYNIELEGSKTGSQWHEIKIWFDGRQFWRDVVRGSDEKDLKRTIDHVIDKIQDNGSYSTTYFEFGKINVGLLEAQGIAPRPARLASHGNQAHHMDESQKDQEIIFLREQLKDSKRKIKDEDEDTGQPSTQNQTPRKKARKKRFVFVDLTKED